jgi:hypothetical protein
MANNPLLKRPNCWLSRDGQRVTGNPEPDPHYLEFEMNSALHGLVFNGKPYELEIWLELEFLEEDSDFQNLH